MEYFQSYERPDVDGPVMLFAFSGWADAAESATHALRYLVKRLGAKKFAAVDPEEFYNFTQARPHTGFDKQGDRELTWPANEFFAWKGQPAYSDVVIFLGTEPSLRWRTFCEQLVGVAKDLGVTKALQIGALLDAVPHTREPRITGTAMAPELQDLLQGVEVRRSRYSGPTGITGVFGDALRRSDIPCVSLWGHSPHYLHIAPNPKVTLGLVKAVEQVLRVDIDVEPLRSQESSFDLRVAQALEDEPALNEYVKKLESQYDRRRGRSRSAAVEMPEPDEAVRDTEHFLRSLRGDTSAQGN
jgi:proteasome assembly chaperone (PAC2) family protein